MALIEIIGVYKIYNPGEYEVRALDGVNLTVNGGEFIGVVGQSGSGKTTLMNILGCLDMPSRGDYRLSGSLVSGMKDSELSVIRNEQIGFIFQGYNLIPSLTAIENVELPLVYRGIHREERRKLAAEALDKVGLSNRAHHKPSQMSGGQQQRTAIARAIAARPPMLLADEPTGNLDSRSGTEVMNILTELNSEGRTILLITHDERIADACSRLIRIADGRIVEDTG